MPCVVAIVALMVPRVVMFFVWLLTNWFDRAFQTMVWPLLGFFFMPYTTLAYMAAILNAGQVSGLWLVLVIVAAIVDVGHWGGGSRTWRRRQVL
jgi:hypothetical protein